MSEEDVRAYLDESHTSSGGRGYGRYLISAVILTAADRETHLPDIRALGRPGQTKMHWRDESDARRLEIAKVFASLTMLQAVVVRDAGLGKRQERQRRLCLKRQLHELDRLGVRLAIMESRGRADDARDRHLVDSMRATGELTGDLRLGHEGGRGNPALWLPDALCGMVHAHYNGDSRFIEMLRSDSLDLIEIG